MCSMRISLALVVSFLALVVAAPASAATVRVPAARDISFPFACTWAWDWGAAPEHRCGWDDSASLRVGADVHNVWRPALEFSLDAIPPGAEIEAAFLGAWFDGGCVAARLTRGPCPSSSYAIEAWSVVGEPWSGERAPDLGSPVGIAWVGAWSGPRWWWIDVTELVRGWIAGAPNRGVVLKLPADVEATTAGPLFASSDEPCPELRPWLEIDFDAP